MGEQKSEHKNKKSRGLSNNGHLTGSDDLLLTQLSHTEPVGRNVRLEVMEKSIPFSLKEVLESLSVF